MVEGRHTSPDDIFKPDTNLQEGSVEICDTGWSSKESRITPEELEERVEKPILRLMLIY